MREILSSFDIGCQILTDYETDEVRQGGDRDRDSRFAVSFSHTLLDRFSRIRSSPRRQQHERVIHTYACNCNGNECRVEAMIEEFVLFVRRPDLDPTPQSEDVAFLISHTGIVWKAER